MGFKVTGICLIALSTFSISSKYWTFNLDTWTTEEALGSPDIEGYWWLLYARNT